MAEGVAHLPEAAIWSKLQELVSTHQHFLISTHVNADGDGLGAEIALYHFLREAGKQAVILNPDPTPPTYRFLDPHGAIQAASDHAYPLAVPPEVIFVVDIHTLDRLGPLAKLIGESSAIRVCIDHHPLQPQAFAELRLMDEAASATGELVYDLIVRLNGTLTKPIAQALYVSLVTDTGGFRYSNTTSRTHAIVADILRAGIIPKEIHSQLYERNSLARMRLLGQALSTLQTECDGQLASLCVTQEMFQQTGALYTDTEGFVEFARALAGVEVGLQFVETEPGVVKVSLRSNGRIDVNDLARGLGGGGHRQASGVLLSGSVEEVRRRVCAAAKERLR